MTTINQTLRNIGQGPGVILVETIQSFEALSLTDQERVSAIASSIAASARLYHDRRIGDYLWAIRASAMVFALEMLPPPPSFNPLMRRDQVDEGVDMLLIGLSELIEACDDMLVGLEDRIVAEMALYARVLGWVDASTVQLIFTRIDDALHHHGFEVGDLIEIPLADPSLINRTTPIHQMPILGAA